MAHRTKEGQRTHDLKVAAIARRLEALNYRVKADLPGHGKPSVMGGYVPDVVATKRGRQLIREVETPGTISTDRAQHAAFRRFAKERGAQFRIIKAKRT